ncbi:MAG: phosphoribosylglycinamide formyltransferase [Pseudomonadota bacterium]
MAKLRVAVLISGRGSNLQSLIDACAQPDFPAEIVLVISNRPGAYGLERAQKAGIPAVTLDHKAYASKADFEAAIDAALAEANVELVCLAGFMRLLSADFVRRWEGRMINIHPSLLPSFKGLHTHRQTLDAGVKIAGCTVHFVVPEMDAGPIIVQAAVPVLQGDDEDALAARVLSQEHQIYPSALKWIAEGRVQIVDGRVQIDGARSDTEALRMPGLAE